MSWMFIIIPLPRKAAHPECTRWYINNLDQIVKILYGFIIRIKIGIIAHTIPISI